MVKEHEQILGTYVADNVLKVGIRDLNLTLGGVIVLCFWARLFSLGPPFQVAGLNDTKLVMTWHRLMLYPVEESKYALLSPALYLELVEQIWNMLNT